MAGLLTDFGIGGARRVTYLPSVFSWNSTTNLSADWPGLSALSGSCTADTWKTILSITGSGARLNALLMIFSDATARTGRLRITIDGVVAFDATATNSGGSKHLAVGQCVSGTITSLLFHPVDANSSLLIEYQGSLTETDKASFLYHYELRA